LIEQQNK